MIQPALKNNNALKTHCKQGHEFNKINTNYINNTRKCRACDLINHKKAYQKNHEKYRKIKREERERKKEVNV